MARPSPNGADGGRDAGGRFAAGNPGGPGNPYARRVAALRSALLDAVTADDVREMARALLDQAKAGDAAAARLLLSYTVGPPLDAAHPDRLDADEYDVQRGRPSALDRQLLTLG